ncbi:DUF1905 domain-containing protein [Nocardia seriolae]
MPTATVGVMANPGYSFTAELWEWEAQASWFFVSLPETVADDIDELYGHTAAGFGSIKVQVTVGDTRWSTSIFPDGKRGTFVLPVKKAVRVAEGLEVGDPVEVELEIA